MRFLTMADFVDSPTCTYEWVGDLDTGEYRLFAGDLPPELVKARQEHPTGILLWHRGFCDQRAYAQLIGYSYTEPKDYSFPDILAGLFSDKEIADHIDCLKAVYEKEESEKIKRNKERAEAVELSIRRNAEEELISKKWHEGTCTEQDKEAIRKNLELVNAVCGTYKDGHIEAIYRGSYELFYKFGGSCVLVCSGIPEDVEREAKLMCKIAT